MQQSSIQNFKQYSNFKSLEDFNNNIEMFLASHKSDFTHSEYIAFLRLTKFCAKVPGIANASIKTILKAISDRLNGFGISESTFQRMKRKAVKLGILTIQPTERKNGSQSSNLWIFNRFNVSVSNTNDIPMNDEIALNQQDNSEQLTGDKTHKKHKTNNIKDINKRDNGKLRYQNLDSTFVSNKIPKAFTSLAGYFFNDPKTIEELYLVVKQVTKYYFHYTDSDKAELACESLKQLVRNMKIGKRRIDNIFGYYNKIVHGILDKRFEEFMSGERTA